MKTEQPILITSVKALTGIPKNVFVSLNGNIADTAHFPLGVSNDSAVAGDIIPVAVNGIVLVQTGATPIAALSPVTSDANGFAVVSADPLLTRGIALDAGNGDLIRILLR
ncbi:MAG: capsid cement protein [Ignavibacteriaceae bacterium]